MTDTTSTFHFTDEEIATILHGLRLIQCEGRIEGCAAGMCDHFIDMEQPTNDEIDALCLRLNFPSPAQDTNLIRTLYCTCCGEQFRGRQFHNQDTGHGMGPCCVERVLHHRPFGHESMTLAEFQSTYGVWGVHFGVEE